MPDELDELYRVNPERFTALRAELAAAAKKRGDPAAAKQISAARKPTTAAWVANLVTTLPDAVDRLRELGAALRAAHTTMNGERLRELTVQQRKLVDELSRLALAAAEIDNPTSALRDDVHGTLQAAIADPEVTARVGRLAKAERWSGFGEFGSAAPVSAVGLADDEPVSSVAVKPRRTAAERRADREAAEADAARERARAEEQARLEAEQARAELAAAEQGKADAEEAVLEQRSRLESARQRREEVRKELLKADRELSAAESSYESAQEAVHAAAKVIREVRTRLKRR